MPNHLPICEFSPKRLLVCTGGCGFVISQDELAGHDCTKALMGCVSDQKKQIESMERELKKLRLLVKEQKSEITLLKVDNFQKSVLKVNFKILL